MEGETLCKFSSTVTVSRAVNTVNGQRFIFIKSTEIYRNRLVPSFLILRHLCFALQFSHTNTVGGHLSQNNPTPWPPCQTLHKPRERKYLHPAPWPLTTNPISGKSLINPFPSISRHWLHWLHSYRDTCGGGSRLASTPRSSETWLIYEPTILRGLPVASDKVVMDVANLMVACVCMSVCGHVCFAFYSRESETAIWVWRGNKI